MGPDKRIFKRSNIYQISNVLLFFLYFPLTSRYGENSIKNIKFLLSFIFLFWSECDTQLSRIFENIE